MPDDPKPTTPVYHCTRCSATSTSKGGTCNAPLKPGGPYCKGTFQ